MRPNIGAFEDAAVYAPIKWVIMVYFSVRKKINAYKSIDL
jgi:hypothetical protein